MILLKKWKKQLQEQTVHLQHLLWKRFAWRLKILKKKTTDNEVARQKPFPFIKEKTPEVAASDVFFCISLMKCVLFISSILYNIRKILSSCFSALL